MELLRTEDLSFSYPGSKNEVLKHISFSIDRGDLLCLIGTTGSGKTTLMKLLKPELAINGRKTGRIFIKGKELSSITKEESVKIGYVMQNPDEQMVCDKVWHELAFGLENIGTPPTEMKLRIAEVCAYFGLGELLYRDVSTLSGGQKQLLNLASVIAMDPELLLLDEPCAQLDPISASMITDTIYKINRELGITVIITEHRTDNVLQIANKVLALDEGFQVSFGEVMDVVTDLKDHHTLSMLMNAPVKMSYALSSSSVPALTVAEGARLLHDNFKNDIKDIIPQKASSKTEAALKFTNVSFRYEKNGKNVIKDLSLTVNRGELFCILGENGSGKSTLMLMAASVIKTQGGSIRVFGKKLSKYTENELYEGCLSYMPQDTRALFIYDTVEEELHDVDVSFIPFNFTPLLKIHPYDLSGGESQMLALTKALKSKPKLLILDEPTKGIDYSFSTRLGKMLQDLTAEGITVVVVTHDTCFAAKYADRCAMIFDGCICSVASPEEFFSKNIYYTTPYSRMSRGFYDNAVTLEKITELCKLNGHR